MSTVPADLFASVSGPIAELPELARLVDALVDAERELELLRARREQALAVIADDDRRLENARRRSLDARAAFDDYVRTRVGMPI